MPGPLAQPIVPVLAEVLRRRRAGERALSRQHKELTPIGDVVVEAGDTDAEMIGDGLHADAVESEFEHGLGDGVTIDAGGASDLVRR